MNAERLLAHYEKIAEAADAVARLRRFILDLAVRGKLVPQDVRYEPASELLKRIAAEKARLVKAGEVRKPKELPLDVPELPFAVPTGWTVAPLDGLSPRSLSDGDWIETKDQSADGGVRLIQLADVGVGEFLNKSARYITEETEIRLNCTRLVVGDVLIARLPNPIGRACTFPDIGQPAITAVDVAILRPDDNVSGQFLVVAMNAPPIREQIEAYGKGATRFRVSTGHLKSVQIPLPPLAEQHRIVSKVDELMALCDRLEAMRQTREATRNRLTAASFARISAPDSDAFAGNARFVLDALPALTARADQIKHLRQTILNLAIRGKLVSQDPNDEPAPALVKRMVQERKAILEKRKIRGAQPPAEPLEKEAFALPTTWQLCSLGQVTLVTDPNPSHRYPDYAGGTIPILSTREFAGENGWNSETAKLTTRSFWEFQKEICDFAAGDIIFARKGRLGLARFLPPFEAFTFSHTLFVIKPMSGLDPHYLLWLLRRDEVVDWLMSEMNQNTGVPTLGKEKTERLPVAVPPLAEQHRIVVRVGELMALCDRLEASLSSADESRSRLLKALLAEALAPAGARELEAAE